MNHHLKSTHHHVVSMLLAHLLFLVSNNAGATSDVDATVMHRLVFFNPPIRILESEEKAEFETSCAGFIYSSMQLAMPLACLKKAVDLMAQGTVNVVDSSGAPIGQLPDYSQTPLSSNFRAISQLMQTEQTLLLPFISESAIQGGTEYQQSNNNLTHLPSLTKTEAEYRATNDTHFLYLPDETAGQPYWQLIQLNKKNSSQGIYFAIAPLTASAIMGAPVINQQGQVVCLLTENGECQAREAERANSCEPEFTPQFPYMTCTDIEWKNCQKDKMHGTCMNVAGEVCSLDMFTDGTNIPYGEGKIEYCKSTVGCGQIICPLAATNGTANPDCMGVWGFCGIATKDFISPSGCLSGHNAGGTHDCRCTNSCPKGAGFYGLVVGVPVAATVLTATVVIAIVASVYKFRKRGYQSISD